MSNLPLVKGQLVVRRAKLDQRATDYKLPEGRKLVFAFGILEVGADMPTGQVLDIQGAHHEGSADLGFDVMSSKKVPIVLEGWPVEKFVEEFKWNDGIAIEGTTDADWVKDIDQALKLISNHQPAEPGLLDALRGKVGMLHTFDPMRQILASVIKSLEDLTKEQEDAKAG